ncbi:MAG TPA: c-type cytochrome domain-containing protein [Humisphaera sp.]|jgi:hypothetical protein|nr:c-type cytochrome domain-containing protein [Humisphaera sp.]
MSLSRSIQLIAVLVGLGIAPAFAADPVNYQDNILPIFRDICLNCHNPDKKKAGLDLSNYQSALAGSNNGPVISAGDADASLLSKVLDHSVEPNMPPKGDKLPQKQLDLIRAWIATGALETKTGKPIIVAKAKVDMGVTSLTLKKPDGPPPMPRDLSLEPTARSSRSWAVNCMAASPWAPVVAVGGQHQILLYDPENLALLGIVPWTDGEPCVAKFSRNGKMLLIGGGVAAKSGKVSLWDITSGKHVTDVGDEFDAVLAADISADQASVALGGPNKTLKLYSTQDGSAIAAVKKHTDWITAIAFSPDGVLLASADRAGGMWVWESKTAREFYNLAGHKAGITAVAFRDDSNVLASASEDGTIKLWDMQEGKNIKSWNAHGGGVLSLAFTHDGRLVSAGRDRVVKIWKPDGTLAKQLDAFNDIALQATFDHDGARVIGADWTGEIRVWDSVTGKLAGKLDPNPPTIQERIAAVQKRLDDAKPLREKAAAEFDRATRELQAAQANFAKIRTDTDAVLAQSQTDEQELAKLKAGMLFENLLAARKELASRQIEQDQLAAQLAAAKADADKAAAAVAVAQKQVDEAPALMRTSQAAVDKANEAVATADAAADTANASVGQKQLVVKQASELLEHLSAESAKSPDNKALADAAAKAKTVVESLESDLATARKLAEQRSGEADAARTALTTAKAAMDKQKQEFDRAPTALAQLRATATTASSAAAELKSQLDKATQATSAAKGKLDQITSEYERIAPKPAAPPTTQKSNA